MFSREKYIKIINNRNLLIRKRTKVSWVKICGNCLRENKLLLKRYRALLFNETFFCMTHVIRNTYILYRVYNKRLSHFINVFHTDANHPWLDYKNKCNEHIKLLLRNEYIYIINYHDR